MRIGHYVPGLRAHGGVSAYVNRLAAGQMTAGNEVWIWDAEASENETTPEGLRVLPVSSQDQLSRSIQDQLLDVLHLHTGVASALSCPPPLVRTIHGHQPYCPSGGRFLARTDKACHRTPSILGCTWGHIADRCGSARPANLLADFMRTEVERRALIRIPSIAVSEFVREQMRRAGYPPQLVYVALSPAPSVPDPQPPPVREAARFVFLGRLTAVKGGEWLIRAFHRVRVSACLDIVGEGPEEGRLQALVRELGLESRVVFRGWVDFEEVHRTLAASRALVFPSLWPEPAGLVSLDAAANARAVIGSRVGGIPEYVREGRSGYLIMPGDTGGLAQAIEELATNWKLARDLGRCGYRLALQEHSIERHVETINSIYRLARSMQL